MEKSEFLKRIHELKQEQVQLDHEFRAQEQTRKIAENAELDAETRRFEDLKERSQEVVREIKARYKGINLAEKETFLKKRNNLDCQIAGLRIRFFEEHPYEPLSIGWS